MMTRAKLAIGGALIGLALLTATNVLLVAQASSAAADGAPMADHAAMMAAATPEADDALMAEKMDRMMDQCLAMMEMMNSMMGMMGGEDMEGMQGMEDMPEVAATPGS